MKRIFFLLLLLPSLVFSQRQIEDGTKLTKTDFLSLNNQLYKTTFEYFSDFLNTVGTATGGTDIIAVNSGTGAATSAGTAWASNVVGVVRSTTGTTATGRTAVVSAATAVSLGGGAWKYEEKIRIPTTSNSTERYQFAVGFIDVFTSVNQVDGAYLLYDEGGATTGSTATGNWQTVTTSNSSRTFNQNAQNSTAVVQGTEITVSIEVNAAANSVVFKVNGVIIGTHTSTIPTGAGRETGFGWLLIKSVGTTARTVDVDYLKVLQQFTTTR